jgi:hypothetical protein
MKNISGMSRAGSHASDKEYIAPNRALDKFLFARTVLIFTQTSRMVGSQVTNRMHLMFALIYLVILNIILFSEPLLFSAKR